MTLRWTASRWSSDTHYSVVKDGFYAARPHRGPFGWRWSLTYYPDEWDGNTCRFILGQEYVSLSRAQQQAEEHWNKPKSA